MSELINQISKLSISERILLVQEILATISTDTEETTLTDAQLDEIDKRSESIKNGKAKTVSWEHIQHAINERYGV